MLRDGTSGYRVVSATFPTSLFLEWWLRDDAALLRGALGEIVAGAAPALVAAVLQAPDVAPPPPPQPPDTGDHRVEDGTLPVKRLAGWGVRFIPAELRAWARDGGGSRR